MFSESVKKYAIQCHENTNHLYDDYLPYQFHLDMVMANAHRFRHLLPEKKTFPYTQEIIFEIVSCACYGHDLIEDARKNYSPIYEAVRSMIIQYKFDRKEIIDNKEVVTISYAVANIIYAVTNEKGKNRKERESDKYFEGIRTTPYALFVKLCDRLANIQYSKMTCWKSDSKLKMYEKEHQHFNEQLYDEKYKEMFDHIQKLFTEK